MKARTCVGALAASGLLVAISPAASAAACSGVSVGSANTANVTLGSNNASACDISGENPQQGPTGNIDGFSDNYGGGWTLLTKVTTPGSYSKTFGGVGYTIDFSKTDNKNGSWTVTVDQAVTVDLVFAMHASNHSGAFLFDNQWLSDAASGNGGSWTIQWLNNGNQVPDYSNLTVFAREQTLTPVPETESWAMMLAGLGTLAALARRRRA